MNDRPDAPGEATPELIVGISFADAFRAKEFLTASYRLASQQRIEMLDAVTIVKNVEGKTFVQETVDPQPLPSALSGGLWAGFFGLILGGPVGWLAGAAVGAGAGLVRAKIVDLGVPDEWVSWFRDAVQPETVTIVLLLGRYEEQAALAELTRFHGAHLVYANVGQGMVERIRVALDDPERGPLTQPADPPSTDEASAAEWPAPTGEPDHS